MAITFYTKSFMMYISHDRRAFFLQRISASCLASELQIDKVSKNRPKKFKYEWFDDHPEWRVWLQEVPNDADKVFCVACNKTLASGKWQVDRHSKAQNHVENMKKLNISEVRDFTIPSTSSAEEKLSFNDRVKVAEIKLATFFVEHNIPFSYSGELLNIFQEIGKEPGILQSMFLGRLKLTNIINNVVCPYETRRITDTLKHQKFSVLVDETSDISNEKKMTLLTRYVDNKSLCVQTDLLQLINLDASDCSAEKIFNAFSNELIKKEIPLSNIIGLGCDNASVMIGRNDSFKTKLLKKSPLLVTMPCICHSCALVASNASKALPSACSSFIKNLVGFIRGSPKRTAIFKDFQMSFMGETSNILKYAETRWLSRHQCIQRILEEWDTLHKFLLEQVAEKVIQAEQLLVVMEDIETKAYLLFLEHVLNKVNSFNAFFQARETKIHRLYEASFKLLMFFVQKFMKPALIKKEIFLPNLRNINFSRMDNQLPIEKIDLGSDCAEYLENKLIENKLSSDQMTLIRQNCLAFLIKASQEICDRFPISDSFFQNLNILNKEIALFDNDRENTCLKLLQISRRLGIFNDECIKQEWISLYTEESSSVKAYWSKLSFDDMWKAICFVKTCNNEIKYPHLRSLLNIVRSLPHSNAEAERCFSILPDNKTRKRNKLGHETLNSICVIKYALISKKETSLTMTVTRDHLQAMCSDILYSSKPPGKKSQLNLCALDDNSNDEVCFKRLLCKDNIFRIAI
ncbi:SCAN domain-containing protein 3-like [Prorops nasuta]|uniref:SCAN domain-containing protein 3-like n=1 Tax=Prorops nasuta TaxID=863751 RepID=UPI0034CD1B34